MNNATGKAVSVLLVLFLLIYAGYQVYRYAYRPYRTEVAYQYAVSDTVYSHGVVVRKEKALTHTGSGVVSYAVEEADKVSVNYPLAYYYTDAQQAKNVALANELDKEIALLQKVQAPGARVFTNNESLTGHIDELVGDLVDIIAAGSGEGTQQISSQLLENICKQQLSVNAVENFNPRIDELTARKRMLDNDIALTGAQLVAPDQGYFSRYVDHNEEVLTPDALFAMSAEEVQSVSDQKYTYDKDAPGKLVESHIWYYATTLDLEDADKFRAGDSVYVTFDAQQLRDVPMEIDRVTKEDTQAVVILRSETIIPGALAMRSVVGEINFKGYSGLRVSESAVRMVDGVVGVYVVTGYNLKFKPIDIIYDGVGYKLCTMNYTNQGSLKLFDEVVVEGTDLYDEKPLLS